MRAEIIIDLHSLGEDIGRARGRNVRILPSLGTVAELWKALGVEVSAIHAVVSSEATSIASSDFSDLHTAAWWKTEQAFAADHDFEIALSVCPKSDDGPVGLYELMTTLALSRSDILAKGPDDLSGEAENSMVIVMSNSPDMAHAVTHARGVPVMIAGVVIPDPGLAHMRLDLSWVGLLKDRFAAITLPGIELRNGRPWSSGEAISTPYMGTEGRDLTTAVLPSFAESVALFDPDFFEVDDGTSTTSPRDAGLAAVVHTLGLGAWLHIEDVSAYSGHPTQVAAAAYRFAADNPDSPVVIASTRPSLIALTSDLDKFAVPNPERVLRLCLPTREASFDEVEFASDSAASRIVIERSLAEPLFSDEDLESDEPENGRHLHVVPESAIPQERAIDLDSTRSPQSPSPTLTLYANPNTIREVSSEWREQNARRFLLLGSTGAEATPADANDGAFLPISLGGCTDFTLRRPSLRPGCIVEGVLHDDGSRWLVVSDPIERRRRKRALDSSEHAETDNEEVGAA